MANNARVLVLGSGYGFVPGPTPIVKHTARVRRLQQNKADCEAHKLRQVLVFQNCSSSDSIAVQLAWQASERAVNTAPMNLDMQTVPHLC